MRVLFFTAIASANSQTLPGGASAADAINAAQQLLNAAIGRFDTNGDGRIDEKDQLSSAVLGVVLGSMDRNGDGVIDVNDFMPIINTLDVNGDGFVDLSDLTQAQRSALSIYDTNGDGRIDDADLAGILANLERNSDGSLSLDALPSPIRNAVQSALDGASGGFDAQLIQDLISRVNAGNINLDDLPANIRTQLEAALNSGLDDQIAPILTALRATPAGQEILDTMDTDEDGQLSAEEVLVGWRALEQLDPENLPIQPDGSVNISTLPAGIQRALRRSLDADHDGRIQPAEMQTWLESLGTEAVSARLLRRFDTNGDGVLDDAEVISLLPPQLQGHSLSISELPPTVASDLLLAASRVGLGNIDEISPARLLAAAHTLNMTAASGAYQAIAAAILSATVPPPSQHGRHRPPPSPGPPSSGTCLNTCFFASDGECDDGGAGSEFPVCTACTDCNDCGPRIAGSCADLPPFPHPLRPPPSPPPPRSTTPAAASPPSPLAASPKQATTPAASPYPPNPPLPPWSPGHSLDDTTSSAAQHTGEHPAAGGLPGWLTPLICFLVAAIVLSAYVCPARVHAWRAGRGAGGGSSPGGSSSRAYKSHVDETAWSGPIRGLSMGAVVESPLQMMELSAPASIGHLGGQSNEVPLVTTVPLSAAPGNTV